MIMDIFICLNSIVKMSEEKLICYVCNKELEIHSNRNGDCTDCLKNVCNDHVRWDMPNMDRYCTKCYNKKFSETIEEQDKRQKIYLKSLHDHWKKYGKDLSDDELPDI
jgi:hypothetical protein